MNITELYSIFLNYPLISTDSRKIEPNSIFFALKGDNFNGNLFAGKALNNGASFAVIDDAYYKQDDRFILVDDSLKTLRDMAEIHRKHLEIPIIAITGTNGKTTTKELIKIVLSEKYNVFATKGNLNNHIGVPLTLLSMNNETELGIVEMGANHPKEISSNCRIAHPDYAVITNIGKAHLQGFGSFEGVINTKGELYEAIAKKDGHIFINADNQILVNLAQSMNITNKTEYSTLHNAGIIGKIISMNPFIRAEWIYNSEKSIIQTRLVGNYNLENILAAITVGIHFNVEKNHINNAIARYKPANNRSQWIETSNNKLLLDAYNANPTSMSNAIKNFIGIEAENKLLILGDMLELGKYTVNEHEQIIEQLINAQMETSVVFIGKHFAEAVALYADKNFNVYTDVNELIDRLSDKPVKKHTILLKGSRGIQLEKAAKYL